MDKRLTVIAGTTTGIVNLYVAQKRVLLGLFSSAITLAPQTLTLKRFSVQSINSAKAFKLLIDKEIDELDLNDKVTKSCLRDSSARVKTIIYRQMLDDIAQLKVDLLRYIMIAQAEEVKGNSKTSAALIAQKTVNFVHIDRIGRRRNAEKYIDSLVRMWAVTALYDAALVKALLLQNAYVELSNGNTIVIDSHYWENVKPFCHPNTAVVPIA